jgi:malonate decarboxylase delta subunit
VRRVVGAVGGPGGAGVGQFRFDGGRRATALNSCVVGVVASGNLEVLIEPTQASDDCTIDISTAANGFGEVWRAVMADFFERHPLTGIRISINDAGATPAIVALRLDQAIEEFIGPDSR